MTVHFNLASSTVWSTTFLCVYWPCFLLPFSLSSFSVPLSLFFVLKPPHLNSCQLTARPTTNCSDQFLSSPLCPLLCYCSFHLPNPLSPPFIAPNLDITCKFKKTQQTHNIGTSLVPWSSSVPPLSSFLPPPHLRLFSSPSSFMLFESSLSPLVLSSFSSSLISSPSSMVLWPSCGPRCLWPADMSRLHSTVLHSAPSFFPSPLFPIPLWPPAPLLPLLSLKSVTPHCLFILFGTLSSFHLLFYYYCYLARWACLVSCCWLCFFFNHWCLVIRLQGYEGWGCLLLGILYGLLWLLWVCVRTVRWEHHTKLQHFIFNSSGWLSVGKKNICTFSSSKSKAPQWKYCLTK